MSRESECDHMMMQRERHKRGKEGQKHVYVMIPAYHVDDAAAAAGYVDDASKRNV